MSCVLLVAVKILCDTIDLVLTILKRRVPLVEHELLEGYPSRARDFTTMFFVGFVVFSL